MHKKILTIGVVALTVLLTGCGNATLKNGETVVAKMKGKTITAEDLYSDLKKQGGATTLTNMIDNYVVNKEIKTDDDAKSYAESQLKSYKSSYESYGKDFDSALKSAGYTDEDEFKKALILEYKKKTVTENYVKSLITDDEINQYYNEKVSGDIEAKHILISANTKTNMSDSEKTKAENAAKKEAESIIKKLKKGENFEKLAKQYSDDKGTASKGGKLTVTYGSVVDEFWNALVNLKDGEYTTSPVKSEYGYHIIYRVSQKDKPKLSKVKSTIIEKLVSEKTSADSTLQTKALVALRRKYKLDITDDDLEKSYEQSVSSALSSTSSSTSSSSTESSSN